MKKRGVIFCCFAVLIFNGCCTATSGIYGLAEEERSSTAVYTDEQIKLTIYKRFQESDINVFDYAPYCYNGHVYLVGEYETAERKEQAVKIAHSVPGVKEVTTYLLPKRKVDACGTMDKTAISTKVQASLINDSAIHSTKIDVKVVRCHVVLLGVVGTDSEAAKAVAHARSVEGVSGVVSFLNTMR
jgi:hyperosmotically inducible periplasmic protein